MQRKIVELDQYLSRQSPTILLIVGVLLIVLLGLLDYATGTQLSLSVFYLLPIFVITWYTTTRCGILISLASLLVFAAGDISVGDLPAILVGWNIIVRALNYLVAIFLFDQLKKRLEYEHELAMTDSLTGAANHRLFYEIAEREIARARRNGTVFTVAYLDIDDFKSINDNYGHHAGDRALIEFAKALKKNSRTGDVVARIGGDEFAILFHDASSEAVPAMRHRLNLVVHEELIEFHVKGYSTGIVTFFAPPASVDDLLKEVDRAMYVAKAKGKNQGHFETYTGA